MTDHFNLLLDTSLCTACRACELGCHYHHTGNFGTALSSIRVHYGADTGDVEIALLSGCDHCASEPDPRCASACVPQAIQRNN